MSCNRLGLPMECAWPRLAAKARRHRKNFKGVTKGATELTARQVLGAVDKLPTNWRQLLSACASKRIWPIDPETHDKAPPRHVCLVSLSAPPPTSTLSEIAALKVPMMTCAPALGSAKQRRIVTRRRSGIRTITPHDGPTCAALGGAARFGQSTRQCPRCLLSSLP